MFSPPCPFKSAGNKKARLTFMLKPSHAMVMRISVHHQFFQFTILFCKGDSLNVGLNFNPRLIFCQLNEKAFWR